MARTGFTEQRGRYEAPGEGNEVDPYLAADLALTKRIAETLERHYSSHPWMVSVTHAQGVAMIKLPILMKRDQVYVIHIANLANDPGLKTVVRAGGELLERFAVPRSDFRLDDFLTVRERVVKRPRSKLILPNAA